MSTTRTSYEITFDHYVGETKTYTVTVKDPDSGDGLDMSNTTTYDEVIFKIIRPDLTQVVSPITGSFNDRATGKVDFIVSATEAISANAGNWIGLVEVENTSNVTTAKQAINFNIINLD